MLGESYAKLLLSKVAENVDEAKELIDLGFEHLTEIEEVRLFRKRNDC